MSILSDEDKKEIAQRHTWGPDAIALETTLERAISDAEAAVLAKLSDKLEDAHIEKGVDAWFGTYVTGAKDQPFNQRMRTAIRAAIDAARGK